LIGSLWFGFRRTPVHGLSMVCPWVGHDPHPCEVIRCDPHSCEVIDTPIARR